jgi:V/A-type H+-transporting ATPase subunit E
MNEKLEQVTRTLYEQGVEKGKIRAAEMVEEAKKEAEKLLLEAEQKAKLLLEEARDQSAQIHAATLIELRLKTDLTVAELSKRLSIQLTEQLLFEGDSRAVLQ